MPLTDFIMSIADATAILSGCLLWFICRQLPTKSKKENFMQNSTPAVGTHLGSDLHEDREAAVGV